MLLLGQIAGCATKPVALSPDDQTAVGQIETYLNDLRDFRAQFVESGTEGNSAGTVWLDRPGRLRVQYEQPHPKLILANHGRLLLADLVTGATTTMPVANTPLGILLADPIRFAGNATVASVQRFPGELQIGLTRPGAPAQGRLTLQFSTSPMALIGVVVQDSTGRMLSLRLSDLVRDVAPDPALFQYRPSAPPG
ncbi:MAG TPA: outer membrane lipoprotein carrier protein LolA [Acetobacteraceae bacterium]|nr:outer membrane lipoprotein carrier protein LolA [Acetobacteraceae bacterium]